MVYAMQSRTLRKTRTTKVIYLTAKNWLKKEQTKKEVEITNGFKAPWQ